MQYFTNEQGFEGVNFTPEDWQAVQQWVTDRAAGEIAATAERLYLPIGTADMEVVLSGSTIWFDPTDVTPNAFVVEVHES